MDDKKISEEKNAAKDEILSDNEEKITAEEILSDKQLENVAGGTNINTGHG